MLCSNTRRWLHHRRGQRSNSHKLGWLKNSWRAGTLQRGRPRPEPGAKALWSEAAYVPPQHQSRGLNPPRAVFSFLLQQSRAEQSRAEPGSHVRHETEPQEWAESRVSISLWPCAHAAPLWSEPLHRGGEGWRMGRVVKRGEGAPCKCPCNIWTLPHSSVMEHNSLIPLGTDENHFKQPGEGDGRYMKGRGMKKENTGMINRQERRGRKLWGWEGE